MDVGKNNKVQKTSLNALFSIKKKDYNPALHKKSEDTVSISTSLNNEAKSLHSELLKTKEEQGLIGKLWDGFKNITKIGAGSNKVEKAIKDLNNGKLSKEEAQQILENYKDGQKTCLDVAADMISSIVSVAAFAMSVPTGGTSLPVGLAISTGISTALKVGIKGIDAKTNGREYNNENLLYDVLTGSVNGLLAPVTNGIGSSLTKTIGCKLGLEISGDVLEAGAKTTLKNLIVNQSIDVAGGTIKQRALALGAGMAIDGALGGAADNTAREIVEKKKDKNVLKAAFEGFIGGLIMSPIIGGGFRLAGKLGSKIGKKVFRNTNKTPDLPNNPFKQNAEIKSDIQPTVPIAPNDAIQPQPKTVIQSKGQSDIEVQLKPNNEPKVQLEENVQPSFQGKKGDVEIVASAKTQSDDIEPKIQNDSDIKTESVVVGALTPEEILQDSVVKKLKGSLENIPVDIAEKKKFIKEFLMINPKTGEQIDLDFYSYQNDSIKETIESLLSLSNNEISVVLETFLDASVIQDRENIYCSSLYDTNKFVKTCRKCKQRNVFGLFQEMRTGTEKRLIGQPHDFFVFGEISDNDYNKVLTIAKHLKETKKDFYLSIIPDFAVKTNKNTIEYMIDNDLFDMKHYYSANHLSDIFHRIQGSDVETLRKIHQRGLLNTVSDEKRFFPFYEAKILVSELSDEKWQKAIDRNLFTLKTNTGKELNDYIIINLAKLDDDVFSRIHSRKLLDKVGDNSCNLKELILLNDEDWQKVIDRKLKLDKLHLEQYSSKPNNLLQKLLSMSDETWAVAEARGLDFVHEEDFLFIELNDLEWGNIQKRKLNQKIGYSKIHDPESQVRLAKLSDEEYALAQKRNLIKGYERKYNEQSFSQEDEFLVRCNDDDFNLYSSRNIQGIETSLDKKKALFAMSDEQFSRVQNDIIPKTKKLQRFERDKLSDLYKLAYLDSEAYSDAIKFVALDSLKYEQFSYDEIIQIISASPEKRNLLLGLANIPSSINKSNYKKDTLLKLLQYTDDEYKVVDFASRLLSISQLNDYIVSDEIISRSFYQNLEKNSLLVSKINNSDLSDGAKKELIDRLLGVKTDDYTKLSLREKIQKISKLQEAQNSSLLEKEESNFLNIDEEIIKLQDSIKHVIQTTNISKTQAKNMFTRFFANDNPKIFDLLTSTDFSKFAKDGLPLEYPRAKFLKDLSTILKSLDQEQQKIIINKLGISLLEIDGEITGYNGIINLNKLSQNGAEGDVLALARKFIKENKVNTDDDELNEILNSLIQGMPEFINIIGKQQHKTHDFSLDIHILNVLKNILENPEYQKLNNEDKFCLKIAAILHDIAKADSVVDKGHEQLCALYAKDILKKENMSLPKDFVNRVFNLIQHHNWLEQYSKDSDIAPELAVKFRRKNDYQIARIFSEADLKSVKADGSFYTKHKDVLEPDLQSKILMNLAEINKKGHMFLTNKIINKSKVPTITKNGKTYRVIDFSNMTSKTDLSQYGFEPGTTYENLRLFLHAVGNEKLSNIINVINLEDPNYEGFLCASYASLFDNRTYGGNKFGVCIDSSNIDIANASISNQGSGRGKNFERFSDVLTGKDKTSKYRDLIPSYIQNALNLSEDEYSLLFTEIQRIKYSSQFDNIGEVKIGQKSFSAKEIKEAILYACDQLMQDVDGNHNELNLYTPKTNALFAKVDSFDEIPDELLDIAENADLPIFVLGSSSK